MLVLSRKTTQGIDVRDRRGNWLGRMTILRVSGNRVTVGLEGEELAFLRAELPVYSLREPKSVSESPARQRVTGKGGE